MFEEHGLNIARQPDNGANPRPDNRSGWLEGETPDVVEDYLDDAAEMRCTCGTPRRSCAIGADARAARERRIARAARRAARRRPLPAHAPGRAGRRARACLLDGQPVLLLCSNNYLGLRRAPARARGGGRGGDALGRRRRRLAAGVGHDDDPRAPRAGGSRGSRAPQACVLFGSGYLANVGVLGALGGAGATIFSDALNHASIIDGCRLARAEVFVYRHCDLEHLEWGLRERRGEGAVIVTDSVFSMDGDVAPLEAIVELARRHGALVVVDEAHATGALGPGRPRRGRRGRARGRDRRDRRHAQQGARRLRRLRLHAARDRRAARQPRAHADLLDGAAAAGGRRRARRARAARRAAAPARRSSRAPPPSCAASSPRPASPVPDGAHADHAGDRRRCRRGRARSARRCSRAASSLRRSVRRPCPTGSSRLRLDGDGVAHRERARPRPPRRFATPPTQTGVTFAAPAGAARRPSPRERSCAAASSPRPTPASARPILCAALVASLRARGEPVRARKPVLTGLDEPSRPPADHELLASRVGRAPEEVAPLRYGPAVSPHLAAALAGRPIDVAALSRTRSAAAGTVIVEGIGGLLVPLAERLGRARARARARPRRASSPRGRVSARSTTPCSRSRPRGRRASTCERSC